MALFLNSPITWNGNTKKLIVLSILLFLVFDALFLGLISNITDSFVYRLSGAGYISKSHQYNRLPGRPFNSRRIAIVTYYSEDAPNQEIKRLTWSNKMKYCQKHGYDLYDSNAIPEIVAHIDGLKNKMMYPRYFKYAAIQSVMRGGDATQGRSYDWILWLDGDSLILNHGKRIEEIVDERFDVIVTTGPPDHKQWGNVVNAGAFLIRNNDFGQQFIDDALSLSQNHCGEFVIENPEASTPINGWLNICNPDGQFWLWDQGVLLALHTFKPATYKCHVKKTWFRAFNSEFPWYGNGDLIIHFPGRGFEERKKLMKAFLKYSDFSNGKVDHRYSDVLDPEETLTADLVELEKVYKNVNPTCDSL